MKLLFALLGLLVLGPLLVLCIVVATSRGRGRGRVHMDDQGFDTDPERPLH